jgi:hypothetical protein
MNFPDPTQCTWLDRTLEADPWNEQAAAMLAVTYISAFSIYV